MGGRNKHRNVNRRANNQNRDNKNENNNYPKASEQDLQMQCLQLYQLLTNKTKILKEQKLDYCYLISTKWLEDWKQYVGYYNLSQDDEKKHKKIGKKHPGKINFDLVTDNKAFYQVPLDQYDYLNTVVNEKKQQDDDFIAIASQIWLIFASKYDHVEIKRPKRVTKKGSVLYDGCMHQLEVVIANFNDDELVKSIQTAKFMPKRDLDDEFPCSKMQLATLWKLPDLQKFIQKYCQAVYQQKQFKLWKIQGFATVGQIQRGLWDGINKKQSKILLPCRQLTVQKYGDLDLDEFLKDYYSLVLEVGKPRIQRAQVPEQLEGYCEQCIKKKPLTVKCLCEEMFYCSDQCRIVDQVWHEKVCKLAFDSQDDQEYKKKALDFSKQDLPLSGLTNLGNTCYMNSVLQSMVGIKDLSTYFSTEKFQKQIDPKEFQENKGRLLYKYSKFLKALSQNKQSMSPWSLKGQVNYFLPPFKGFKQHDANDFLINFVNSINEQLCKSQGKAFHPILQSNFLGEFNSLIKCPDCSIQISNDEIFTQLTLPIKQKAKVLTTNYVIYQSPKKIIHGKCYVQSTWQKMRKNLELNSSCLLMAAKEGEQAIDVDEDEGVEKTIKKIKRQLVFYPNCNYDMADQLFSILPITQKTMFGNRMKSPYGYPAIINVNPQLHTLGTFWVEILKLFCPEDIYQQAIRIKQNYFNSIQSAVLITNQKDSSSQTQATQKDKDELQQNLTKDIEEKYNKELKQLLNKHKINVFVNDLKKQRNTCAFCKKKCTGCQLPVNFSQNLKQFLEGKMHQVNFEILLGQKIQQEKIQKDIAKSGEATLHDCMELLTEPQQLDEQNAWWCETCENLRLAYKQLTIKKLPKVLIIHLNRFKTEGQRKVKNSEPIEYEEYEIFCGKKYRLLSVIVHQGSTQGGHYWAICRRNEKYYIFNDSKVSQTEKICNKNAYILIYEAL